MREKGAGRARVRSKRSQGREWRVGEEKALKLGYTSQVMIGKLLSIEQLGVLNDLKPQKQHRHTYTNIHTERQSNGK